MIGRYFSAVHKRDGPAARFNFFLGWHLFISMNGAAFCGEVSSMRCTYESPNQQPNPKKRG